MSTNQTIDGVEIRIDSRYFCEALEVVKPHVCRDDTRPVICGYRIETMDGSLYVTGTDSYTLGMVRLDKTSALGEWEDGLSFVLDADFVNRLLKFFKPLRKASSPVLSLVVDGWNVTADNGLISFTDHHGAIDADYPDTTHLIKPALTSIKNSVVPAKRTGFMPSKLKRFDAACAAYGQGTSLEIYPPSERQVMVVTCGNQFIGLIMPIRVISDNAQHLTIWDSYVDSAKALKRAS